MTSQRPITYDALVSQCAEENSREIRLRSNTVAINQGLHFDVYLYETRIASVYDGKARINMGGYRTTTTRNRINDVLNPLGWRLCQSKGQWKLVTVEAPYKSMEYIDNMILTRITNGK